MADRYVVTVDVRALVPVLQRCVALPVSCAFSRHLDAMLRDQAAVELHEPLPGSGFTWRAVPSIELLRLLEDHEARV